LRVLFLRFEEEYYTRLPTTKKDKMQKRLSTMGQFGDEVTNFGFGFPGDGAGAGPGGSSKKFKDKDKKKAKGKGGKKLGKKMKKGTVHHSARNLFHYFISTVKASNFGPHGNFEPFFFQQGLLLSKRVLH
jgi:hypothetical protein